VTASHYFISANPSLAPISKPLWGTRPALIMEGVQLGTTAAAPLIAQAAPQYTLIQANVENMQLMFETDQTANTAGDPTKYTPSWGFPANGFSATTNLRSMRIDLVGVGARVENDTGKGSKSTSTSLAPIAIDNYTPLVATADGYRRIVYSQRVELTNLSPTNL